MKKCNYFNRIGVAQMAALAITLPFQMLPVAEGATQPENIEVSDISCLCVRFAGVGETGIGKPIGTSGATRYELSGSAITVHVAPVETKGEAAILIDGKYGQVKLHAKIVLNVGAGTETTTTVSPYVFRAIAAGGGGDYKTDVYMDGDGRVIMERLEDGSTVLYDEHENPIVKRNADGSTQYFDAYQSARLLIDAHGNVSLNYTEGETVKTLQLAEAVLARTTKHLLSNTAGETTIKDENGNILTHAQIYDMLMNTPDFVVLVRSDHAFHPNLVTPTQIAFTCSYLGADLAVHAERVNITNENVVTYSNGISLAVSAHGGVAFGTLAEATAESSFSHGYSTKATANFAHAEGEGTRASGLTTHAEGHETKAIAPRSHAEGHACTTNANTSHAEGETCSTNGGTSHAEGNYCSTGTNGVSAHAEGSYTTANAAASHTEGYRTTTTAGGSHAQGCWNKVEGGEYAFMHGFGTGTNDRKNAFLIAGSEIYMYGIGGYDGTNYGQEGVQSVQTVIRALQVKTINL